MEETPLLGIFDSGVGGFSVYKKIKKVSSANVVYYGDCLRAPYGNREESEIITFIKDDIRFLQDEGVTYFVNACNSMSVVTTDLLLKECKVSPDHYTDMIRAYEKHAVHKEDEKVLVLGTEATIRSGSYQEVLHTKGAVVFTYIFKDLAGAIEANAAQQDLLVLIQKSIEYAKETNVTSIVYGCTHYPLIHELFLSTANNIGWEGLFINPAIYVAEEVQLWNLEGERRFTPHSSKDTPAFIKNIIEFL